MAETGADVVSLDWLTPLHQAKMRLGDTVALQGNLDPNALFAKPEVVQSLAESMLLEGGSQGYIFNLGHGILPQTPVETVKLLVDTVKSTSFSAFIEPSLVTPLGRE
jgi:uroporphyrinogen decarboxylase